MSLFVLGFLGAAAVLWLTVFGYVFTLGVLAVGRRRTDTRVYDYPHIAIVIPTLNEEHLILDKLADLRRTDYPAARITTVVVDGGSTDRTLDLVQQAIAGGAKIEVMQVDHGGGSAQQVIHALERVSHDIVVVTDVDARLDTRCIRELVSILIQDPHAGVVGAVVRPQTTFLEERIHWWLLNNLWWLEGEVLSSAVVAGVCYAVRRAAVLPLAAVADSLDVNIAMAASAGGFRARICRAAQATEMRVPHNAREFVRFRRRRGGGYVSELVHARRHASAPAGWQLARLLRLWHFIVTPKAAAVLAAWAGVLMVTPYWRWAFVVLAAFVAPLFAAMWCSTTLAGRRQSWRLMLAAPRLLVLTWVSLLALDPAPRIALGGK